MLVKITDDYYINPDHVSAVCLRGGVVSVIMENKVEFTFSPKDGQAETTPAGVIDYIAAKINKRK